MLEAVRGTIASSLDLVAGLPRPLSSRAVVAKLLSARDQVAKLLSARDQVRWLWRLWG